MYLKNLIIILILLVSANIESLNNNYSNEKTIDGKIIFPVVTSCLMLPEFNGKPLENIGFFCFKDGKYYLIPYQIDEKTNNGNYVLTGGKNPGRDGDDLFINPKLFYQGKRLWDKNDEFIVMFNDIFTINEEDMVLLNNKVLEKHIFINKKNQDNLILAVILFKDNDFPRSNKDYVKYIPIEDKLIGEYLSIGFCKKGEKGVFTDITLPKSNNGEGKNILKSLTVIGEASFFFNSLKIKMDESSAITNVKGWIDGPIRIIRRAGYQMKLFHNIKSPSFNIDTKFYSNEMNIDVDIYIPIDVSVFTNKIKNIIGLNFNSNVKGNKIYFPNIEEYFTIDGTTDQNEKRINSKDFYFNQGILTDDNINALLLKIDFPEGFPLKFKNIYKEQDSIDLDKNTYCFLGWDILGVEKLKNQNLKYQIIMRSFPNYNKEEKNALFIDNIKD